MQNAFKRKMAGLVLAGYETTIIRVALASRFATMFAGEGKLVPDRFALYEAVSQDIIRGRSFDYLEFGVFEGASIARVAALNRNPGVRLFGFDSFEGLPQDWNEKNPKGTFTLSGRTPDLNDDRIRFVKGWFDQTVPTFLNGYAPQQQIWIHIDADLYGSAMSVLTLLNPHIHPGCIIVFDEIEDLLNEFKALCDFQDMSGKHLNLVGSTRDCRQAAFVCG